MGEAIGESVKGQTKMISLILQMVTRNLITSVLLITVTIQANLQFKPVAYLIPHPQKVERGGEDAFFISNGLLVAADGVGGWNNQGVDPGVYARFLCSASQVYFNEDPHYFSRHPEELIVRASKNNRYPGSSTMSVVTLDGSTLRSCHIGDCKLLVLRRYNQYRLIFETVDQLHGFNFPYQLAYHAYGGDNPKEALCSTLIVKEGDLIILASDGMADNLFAHEVVRIAERYYMKGILKDLPKKLAKLATERAQKKEGDSPFASKARQWGVKYEGGKIDDTTVIVAEVQDANSNQGSAEVSEL